MKLFCLLLIIFCGIHLNAQNIVSKKMLTDIGIVNNSTASMVVHNGKIVVAGSIQDGKIYKLAILRFLSNGNADERFGNNGVDSFTVSRILPATYQGAYIRSVAIQDDGKILVAGSAWYQSGVNYLSNVLVMRLSTNGLVDSTFGDNGTVRTNINSSTGLSVDEAFSIKLQTDGKIVVAGQSYDYLQHRFLAIRYNTDGSTDNSFGTGGVTLFSIGASDDEAFAMDIQLDGKIVLAGESYLNSSSYRVALARLTAKGKLDNTFGTNGIVTTNISPAEDEAKSVALQTDGKIIIAGTTVNNSTNKSDVLCIRYNSDGSIDSSFSNRGKVIIDVNGQDDVANNLILQPDNKILIGGYSTSVDGVTAFLSIRLLANGCKDMQYASGGIKTTSLYQQGDAAYGMSLTSQGKILLAGQTTNGASNYISIIRYKKNGSTDSSFKNNGVSLTGIGSSEDVASNMLNSPWDNSLFVSGTANGYWVIAKYWKSDLSLDSSFGINGITSAKYKNEEDPQDEPVLAIDAQKKKIYMCGYTGRQVTIVRFNKDGTQDITFGNKAIANYSLSLFYGGFGIESDHKILVCGVRQQTTSGYDFIARLKYDGTIDSSFGINGEIQKLPITANSIQMKKDGSNILLGGRVYVGSGSGIGVYALKTNGSFDSLFGENGLVYKKSALASPQVFFRYKMAQDQQGNIVVSGGVQGSNFKYQFSVTRFLKNGIIDSSFAQNGLFVKDVSTGSFSDNYNEGISAYCVNSNCSVLTSGIKLSDGNELSHAVVILLKNNGAIDSLNSGNGYIDTSFFGDQYEAAYAALIDTITQSKEVMFIAGKASNGVNSDFELIKLIKPYTTVSVQKLPVSIADYKLSITPNPAHNFIQVNYTLINADNTEIKITNINGRPLITQKQYNNAGLQHVNIKLPSTIMAGIYVVTVTTPHGYNECKLLVQ
ncbi:MAG: T9SS type A sorting domain-containing protein [Parafilimonas sp.]